MIQRYKKFAYSEDREEDGVGKCVVMMEMGIKSGLGREEYGNIVSERNFCSSSAGPLYTPSYHI